MCTCITSQVGLSLCLCLIVCLIVCDNGPDTVRPCVRDCASNVCVCVCAWGDVLRAYLYVMYVLHAMLARVQLYFLAGNMNTYYDIEYNKART